MASGLSRDEFLALIPNREPYLWVDEVTSITPTEIECQKYIDPELELFQGHYVGFPLFPGALQCEAAFQAASILIANRDDVRSQGVPVIARVNNVKFRQMVRPGDTLKIRVQIDDREGPAFYMRGRLSVERGTTTSLQFTATEAKTEPLG